MQKNEQKKLERTFLDTFDSNNLEFSGAKPRIPRLKGVAENEAIVVLYDFGDLRVSFFYTSEEKVMK